MIPPIPWIDDAVGWLGGEVGDAIGSGFEAIVLGLVGWVVNAVVWVVGGVFNFFMDAADPNVQADWFVSGNGPYAATTGIATVLMVGFLFAGITQGVIAGDVGGMVRRIALDLPISVLGMVGLITVTQALIQLTDALSSQVMSHFEQDISDFTTVVVSLSRLTGGVGGTFVVFLLGVVTVLAGLVLVAELAIRAALIYVVVALAPFVFATRLWPALQGACRKLLDMLVALIVSKLVMAVALSVAASAAVGTGSGGEVTSLPEPEVIAEDPGGSLTQAVGILLAATAAFGVAAFSPLLIARLLPITEAAVVAQGVRSGPLRAGQQGLSTAYSAQVLRGGRLRQLAAGGRAGGSEGQGGSMGAGLPPSPGGGSPPGAAAAWRNAGASTAAATGLAGPGVLAAATTKAASGAVKQGARTAQQAASTATGAAGGSRHPVSGQQRRIDNFDDAPPVHGRPVPNRPPPGAPNDGPIPPKPSRRPPPGSGGGHGG